MTTVPFAGLTLGELVAGLPRFLALFLRGLIEDLRDIARELIADLTTHVVGEIT